MSLIIELCPLSYVPGAAKWWLKMDSCTLWIEDNKNIKARQEITDEQRFLMLSLSEWINKTSNKLAYILEQILNLGFLINFKLQFIIFIITFLLKFKLATTAVLLHQKLLFAILNANFEFFRFKSTGKMERRSRQKYGRLMTNVNFMCIYSG